MWRPLRHILVQHHHREGKSILACQLQLIDLPCQLPSHYCAFWCILLNFIPHFTELSLCPCFFFFFGVFVFTIEIHSDEHRSTTDCFGTPSVSITSTINLFSQQTFWLVEAGKAQVGFLRLIMVSFYFGELVSGLWCIVHAHLPAVFT